MPQCVDLIQSNPTWLSAPQIAATCEALCFLRTVGGVNLQGLLERYIHIMEPQETDHVRYVAQAIEQQDLPELREQLLVRVNSPDRLHHATVADVLRGMTWSGVTVAKETEELIQAFVNKGRGWQARTSDGATAALDAGAAAAEGRATPGAAPAGAAEGAASGVARDTR